MRILDECPDDAGEEGGDGEPSRWLDRAINHPGGKLTEFLLHDLSRERKRQGDEWTAIPRTYQTLLARILRRDSFATELGSVVLASQLHFLYALDREWAVGNILPLFNWETSAPVAHQAWQGFLVWGRLSSEALVDDLLPFFEQTFSHLKDEIDEYRHQFCLHLAVIAVDSSHDPLVRGWLPKFISTATVEDRASWAGRLEYVLGNRQPQARAEAWGRWLREYWDRRIRGIPLPFVEQELREMAGLTLKLEPIFEEAVAKFIASGPVDVGQDFVVYQLSQTDLPESHPAAAARFLARLLESSGQPFWHLQAAQDVHRRLQAKGADVGVLGAIQEHLARLGQT